MIHFSFYIFCIYSLLTISKQCFCNLSEQERTWSLSLSIKETSGKNTISLVPSMVQPQQEQMSLIQERNTKIGKNGYKGRCCPSHRDSSVLLPDSIVHSPRGHHKVRYLYGPKSASLQPPSISWCPVPWISYFMVILLPLPW